jgi:Cd2+/Zn2+-exporting ATPase
VFVGSHRLFHERALCTDALHSLAVDLEKSARSLVFVGVRGDAQGVIVLDDPLREDARCGLEALREVGVERLSLLTGDNEATAKIVGRHLPLDDVQAELLPAQKVEAIRAMRRSHHGVAMVGDGINDAPALAAADLGIAMGQGADQALETADVALLSGELGKVAWLFRLAKRSVRRIGVNVALAVGLKLGVLLLALVGYGTLWMAVFADTGASLIVIANGLRLLNEKN